MDAGHVFAMPCRTRRFGLEAEAFGIVFLEAAACGLPVIAGASGGAPETVLEAVSGYSVDPADIRGISERLGDLLQERSSAAGMGAQGRAWVSREWMWAKPSSSLQELTD